MSGSNLRRDQLTVRGQGTHFSSPAQPRNKKKTTTLVVIPGNDAKRQKLTEEIAALKRAQVDDIEPYMSDYVDEGSDSEQPVNEESLNPPAAENQETESDKITPTVAAKNRCKSWKILLPKLVSPLLRYNARCIGIPSPIIPENINVACDDPFCSPKAACSILCLFYDHFRYIQVTPCGCRSVHEVLVENGLFPTAPSQPRHAVSIHLLELYHSLFLRSCDAITALSSALHFFYTQRGFDVIDRKGEPVQDPFRRGLSSAVQWHDALRVIVEKAVESAKHAADLLLQSSKQATAELHSKSPSKFPTASVPAGHPASGPPGHPASGPSGHPASGPSGHPASGSSGLPPSGVPTVPLASTAAATALPGTAPGECARLLQQRCPACFGGVTFGTSFQKGGDFHVATDGNFHHRHRKSAQTGPPFYDPSYFLSKEEVDAAGARIKAARKVAPKRYKPKVPDEAVDGCEASHDATNGSKDHSYNNKFDDTGLMALICRHDIPLFFANIDTPGEQQKYAVALLEHLFTLIPPNSMVACLYDVACVIDRSSQLYDIFSPGMTARLQFLTSVMHAYGHQWPCQVIYNPRVRPGFGLTDGEGVERLWSRLRKVIGITRCSGRYRRIWLIDRLAYFIGAELRDDLGDWIKRRLDIGVKEQSETARRTLKECGVPIAELREQWELQQAAQLSVRAHAPVRLKKEIDSLLALQSDLDAVDQTMQAARTLLAKTPSGKESASQMVGLERTHERLQAKVESLYTSLNIHETFPDLAGVNFEFVQTLLMARDLKINIRQRAIASFFEWDKINQASGGREEALGTKLHQHTRKAINKRKPALMTAIRKFNKYCTSLEAMYDPAWQIPLPQPLPTELKPLRNCTHLMEDVWIEKIEGVSPRWLDDVDVREGIRAMLKIDRCHEERRRLGVEADNLCRWYGRELAAIEMALATPGFAHLSVPLRLQRNRLHLLKKRWSNELVSEERFNYHIRASTGHCDQSFSEPPQQSLTWLVPTVIVVDRSLDDHDAQHLLSNTLAGTSITAADNDDGVYVDTASDEDEVIEILDLCSTEETSRDELVPDTSKLVEDVNAAIIWELPADLLVDNRLIESIQLSMHHATLNLLPIGPRKLDRVGLTPIEFDVGDLERLASPTALLNNYCVNSGAALLQEYFSLQEQGVSHHARRCALLSTFELSRIRCNSLDRDLWRNIHRTSYWEKDVWIIPIHRARAGHWVLCAASLQTRELFLFDSYSEKRPWKYDVQDIMRLIVRMVVLAGRNGHALDVEVTGWTARPVQVVATQTNTYDCGVWILACIATMLQGHYVTGISEADIGHVRQFVYQQALCLPIV